MPRRDVLRSKVYRTEEFLKTKGNSFKTITEIQSYVDGILRTRWWKFRYPTAITVIVEEGNSSLFAFSWWEETDRLSLPRWSWREIYVLHELAHVGARHLEGCLDEQGVWADHGIEFIRIYLDLITYKMGRDYSRQFKHAFDLFGIPWRVRKIHLTEPPTPA